MNGTAKTLLIAGGVVVGAYVLMKVVAPTAKVVARPSASTSSYAGIIGSLSAIGSGIGNLFSGDGGGSSSSSSSPSGMLNPQGASAADLAAMGFDVNNVTVTDNFMYTDDLGHFVAG